MWLRAILGHFRSVAKPAEALSRTALLGLHGSGRSGLEGGGVAELPVAEDGADRLHGTTFGALGAVTPLVDLWVEERRLPDHMSAVPR